ncbi:hypothetical protein M885DRAFT_591797, partial [Pelagophyceae sp. CCMP2097]
MVARASQSASDAHEATVLRSLVPSLLSPDDVALPYAKRSHGALRVVAVDVNAEKVRAERLERSRHRLAKPAAPVVDGFLLLEACGVEFPDEGHCADVSGYGATKVAEGDLDYFPRLALLDGSDNLLPLEPFARLPRLRELRLACNRIKDVTACAFGKLVLLDLSYNALDCTAVLHLATLCDFSALRELDLTGNSLRALPPARAMERLCAVERLCVERNGLDEACLAACGTMPELRELQLAHNHLRRVPGLDELAEACGVEEVAVFAELAALGLAHNRIGDEADLLPLAMLPKLEHVALYGNPLLAGAEHAAAARAARLEH